MIYLLLGEDSLAKDQKISEIRNQLLTSPEALEFDYEVLHAPQLDSDILKKALLALPAVSKKRIIVLRSVQKLNNHNKDLILGFIQSKEERIDLILDCDEMNPKDKFFSQIQPWAKVVRLGKTAVEQSVWNMTNAISERNNLKALQVLSDLLTAGKHPLQIMSPLIWFWGNSRPRLAAKKFQEGLLAIEEADLNIKRSRIKPEHAMEVLVVKLCSLI